MRFQEILLSNIETFLTFVQLSTWKIPLSQSLQRKGPSSLEQLGQDQTTLTQSLQFGSTPDSIVSCHIYSQPSSGKDETKNNTNLHLLQNVWSWMVHFVACFVCQLTVRFGHFIAFCWTQCSFSVQCLVLIFSVIFSVMSCLQNLCPASVWCLEYV